jgi:hypothetical protein
MRVLRLLVKLWLLKNSLSLRNDQIWGIEYVSEKGERRLYGILTRFYFCEFLGSEFFKSHACLQQLLPDSRQSPRINGERQWSRIYAVSC